jgi:signal transduction histidine kinase/CheY-like chemotaxis protein
VTENSSNNDPATLVVDDDTAFLDQTVAELSSEGIKAVGVGNGQEALSMLESGDFNLVITDLVMEDMSGIDLLKEIKRRSPLMPVICVSHVRSFADVLEMLRSGASDFLSKPIEKEDLLAASWKAFYEFRDAEEKERIVSQSETWSKELLTLRQLGEASGREMLKMLFDRTIEAVSDTLQVETASLMLTEEEHLRVVAARGIPEEVIGKATVPLGKGISGHVAESGIPLLINDISKHEKFRPSSFKNQYSTQSAICVPLVRGDRVLGVINANNKTTGDSFTQTDLDLLSTMASQVALSIDNARLFQGMEEKAEALERAHQELVELDRDKTELILNISHELKTPLSTLVGFASIIYDLELSGDTDDLYHYTRYLEASANHLNHLVERMLELFRLEAGRYTWNFSQCSLEDSVAEACQLVEDKLEKREVSLDLAQVRGGSVHCDTRFLSRAVELVLENAIKFSDDGTVIEVEAEWCDEMPVIPEYALGETPPTLAAGSKRWLEVVISDQGMGMKEKEIPFIFEKFRQLGDIMTGKPQGIGLGLSIARVIVEKHGGAIWAESVVGSGSRLHILLSGKMNSDEK